jgi:hypothetical protein
MLQQTTQEKGGSFKREDKIKFFSPRIHKYTKPLSPLHSSNKIPPPPINSKKGYVIWATSCIQQFSKTQRKQTKTLKAVKKQAAKAQEQQEESSQLVPDEPGYIGT